MLATVTDRIETAAQEFDPRSMWREQEVGNAMVTIANSLVRRLVSHLASEGMFCTGRCKQLVVS